MNDDLGDRMKLYEQMEASRKSMPGLPVMMRLDGKAFHSYTKGLQRPYDENLSKLMVETTRFLVEETHAKIAYTQSDEISLVLYADPSNLRSILPFNGKYQKLVSVLASMATAKFNALVPLYLQQKKDDLAFFDCRVWQVPSQEEAANCFLWREFDCNKNSISMAAQHYYSHKELHGKHSSEMHQMLFEKGINWNDYPDFFKRGTYLQRKLFEMPLTEVERNAIPEKHRPASDTKVLRSRVVTLKMPPLSKVVNRTGVIFNGEEPKTS